MLYTALAETVRRTRCGEKESDVQSFARSSERRYYHASVWVRVRKERASVDQGWTLYVVTKEMSLWMLSVKVDDGREKNYAGSFHDH